MAQLDYTVTTSKSPAEATDAVSAAAAERNFRVLAIHDVQATLAEKGFEREPLRIIEVCNAGYAHKVLAADVMIGLMLPCPVMVYSRDGQTYISAMRPSLIADFYPEADIQSVADEVEAIIRAIVDAAA